MNSTVSSVKIARAIASIWELHRAGKFLNYLEDTFGVKEEQVPIFRCIYIAETEEGDLNAGPRGGLIKQIWQVDDNGTQEINIPNMDWDNPSFYATPRILFYVEGDNVATNELYGPKKMFRKKGKLEVNDSTVKIVSVEVID